MMGHHFILIVDEDTTIRHNIAEKIAQEECLQPVQAASLFEARQLFDRGTVRIDSLLLDADFPQKSSIDFCIELRRNNIKIPILMMTNSYLEDSIVEGLDAGANDFLVKPLHLREVMARLRAQLRAFEHSEDVIMDIGPYIFRPARKVLVNSEKGHRIYLTEKETSILKYLYHVGDKTVNRQVLLNEVWGYNAGVTTHTLETHIYRLRQKIEPNTQCNSILVTEGGGYKLRV